MNSLKLKLARMAMGDALVSDNGFAIDYVDPSGGTFHEPCYALRRGIDILYMTDNERESDRTQLLAFLKYANHGCDKLDPEVDGERELRSRMNGKAWQGEKPGDNWQLVRSGSDANPMWNDPIGQLRLHNWSWMFFPSPHGIHKTSDWVAKKYNHTPVVKDGTIKSVLVRFSINGEPQDVPVYVIGRVYAVVEKLNAKSASPPLGFVQLVKITERTIGGACSQDLAALGIAHFDQLRSAVGVYSPRRQYWSFEYRVVKTPEREGTVISGYLETLADVFPLQTNFLQAVTA